MDARLEGPLLADINTLLATLQIPVTLDTLLDLIPSIILAIFESMLRLRLPISTDTRQSRTRPAKVEAMKIFLGVLHDDVLFQDVGLDSIDPRSLADGGENEVIWAAALLCWMGRKYGYSSSTSAPQLSYPPQYPLDELIRSNDVARQRDSPSTKSTTATNSMSTNLSMNYSAMDGSNTSMETTSEMATDQLGSGVWHEQYHDSRLIVADVDQSIVDEDSQYERPRLLSSTARNIPRCIHEIPSPPHMFPDLPQGDSRYSDTEINGQEQQSYSFVQDFPSGFERSTMTSVRYDGWIEDVDVEDEIRYFEARKNRNRIHEPARKRDSQPQDIPSIFTTTPSRNSYECARKPFRNSTPPLHPLGRNPTRHTFPSEHSIALHNERVRLLDGLAEFKLKEAVQLRSTFKTT